tara:strand:- start:107 stop:532 length:426 start_codon:yes stop_codon:yes gene_type:complete
MKIYYLLFLLLISFTSFSQAPGEDPNLKFDSFDLQIIELADSILSSPAVWNKQDDRECYNDVENNNYSLFCALLKASQDVLGEYEHRRACMQIVRFTLEKYAEDRVKQHRMMDWNNHPDTSFEEVKKVLRESAEEVGKHLK